LPLFFGDTIRNINFDAMDMDSSFNMLVGGNGDPNSEFFDLSVSKTVTRPFLLYFEYSTGKLKWAKEYYSNSWGSLNAGNLISKITISPNKSLFMVFISNFWENSVLLARTSDGEVVYAFMFSITPSNVVLFLEDSTPVALFAGTSDHAIHIFKVNLKTKVVLSNTKISYYD
jgi:hypothetical protein